MTRPSAPDAGAGTGAPPGSSAPDISDTEAAAARRLRAGEEAYARGRLDEAEPLLTAALAHSRSAPLRRRACFYLGLTEAARKGWSRAQPWFRRAFAAGAGSADSPLPFEAAPARLRARLRQLAAQTARTAPTSAPRVSTSRAPWALAVGAGAAALLGAGLLVGLSAQRSADEIGRIQTGGGHLTTSRYLQLRDAARGNAAVANALFAVAGAAAVTAALLALLPGPARVAEGSPPAHALGWRLSLAALGVGLGATLRWP